MLTLEFLNDLLASTPRGSERLGQTLFNKLYSRCPDIANEIRGTDNDPFYCDKNIPGFFSVLYERAVELQSF